MALLSRNLHFKVRGKLNIESLAIGAGIKIKRFVFAWVMQRENVQTLVLGQSKIMSFVMNSLGGANLPALERTVFFQSA
jgi:hypothetical protein